MNQKTLSHLYNLYVNLDFEELGVEPKLPEKTESHKTWKKHEEEFRATLTKEQQAKYIELSDFHDDIDTALEEQAFADGYNLAHLLSLGNVKPLVKEVVA